MDLDVVVAHDEADGKLAALATKKRWSRSHCHSTRTCWLTGLMFSYALKAEAAGGAVTPLSSLFVQCLNTYLQAHLLVDLLDSFESTGSPLSFTLGAAATGFHYSREASGIPGIGLKTACRSLATMETLSPAAFAACIREHSDPIPVLGERETLGPSLGNALRDELDCEVGTLLGRELRIVLGPELGEALELVVGKPLGTVLGAELGRALGKAVNWTLGAPALGTAVGDSPTLGDELGSSPGASSPSTVGDRLEGELGKLLGVVDGTTLGEALGVVLGPALGE
jgi:hypothetical protein